MKKKASLLISGITTVAMLAVAVGSFAAWNTLSATPSGLTVDTATSTTVTAEKGSLSPDTNVKLVPTNAKDDAVYASGTVKDEIVVGDFDLKAKGIDDSSNVKVAATTSVKKGNEDKSSAFKVLLYKKGESNDYSTVALTEEEMADLKDGNYKVAVKFADADGDANVANETGLNVIVKCDAAYTTAS